MKRAAWLAALTLFAGCRCGSNAPPSVDAGHSAISEAIVAYGKPKVMQAYPLARYCLGAYDVFLVRHPPGDIDTPYLAALFDGPTLRAMISAEHDPLGNSYLFVESVAGEPYRKYVRESAAKWNERELFVPAAMQSLATLTNTENSFRDVTALPNTRCAELDGGKKSTDAWRIPAVTPEIPKSIPLYDRSGKNARLVAVFGKSLYWTEGEIGGPRALLRDGAIVASGLTDPDVIAEGDAQWVVGREGIIRLGKAGFLVEGEVSGACVFDGDVYYGMDGEIRRIGKSGAAVVVTNAGRRVRNLSADADALYWERVGARDEVHSIETAPRRGQSPIGREIVSTPRETMIGYLASSGGFLYWTESVSATVHRVPIHGKAEDATVVRSTEAGVDGLRVEGDNIFVLFRDGRIGKATLGDASLASLKEVFALPPQYPQNLLDEANVYFTYGDRISKIPRSF